MFLAALGVLQRDPHAIVAALPAGHLAQHGARLVHYVTRAAAAVAIRPELPVLVGGYLGSPDPEYPWLEPGEVIDGLEAFGVHDVRRYVERPTSLERSTGLLGALAIVLNARTLVALGHRQLPDVLECLEPLEHARSSPEQTLLCDAVWESMPRASLCRDLLAHVGELGIIAMPDVMTGEWARPALQALAS